MPSLAPCSSCGRHAAPGACPFCGAIVPTPAAPRWRAPARAALVSAAVLAGGCGGGGDADAGGTDAGGTDAGEVVEDAGEELDGGLATPYGAPPMDHLL